MGPTLGLVSEESAKVTRWLWLVSLVKQPLVHLLLLFHELTKSMSCFRCPADSVWGRDVGVGSPHSRFCGQTPPPTRVHITVPPPPQPHIYMQLHFPRLPNQKVVKVFLTHLLGTQGQHNRVIKEFSLIGMSELRKRNTTQGSLFWLPKE